MSRFSKRNLKVWCVLCQNQSNSKMFNVTGQWKHDQYLLLLCLLTSLWDGDTTFGFAKHKIVYMHACIHVYNMYFILKWNDPQLLN